MTEVELVPPEYAAPRGAQLATAIARALAVDAIDLYTLKEVRELTA